MKLKVKRLSENAVIPKYATDGAACFDLVATSRKIGSDGTAIYETGLAFEIPKGHAMLVFSRSGHGFNEGLRLSNCTGVIDSDYRGPLMVKLQSDQSQPDWPRVGDRIAQAMLVKLPVVDLDEVEELTETKRGQGGFGSTGE